MPNPHEKEALEFIRNHPVSQLATIEGMTPFVRIMMTAKIDDDFSIWYVTSVASNKVRHIRTNPTVCNTFHEGGKWVRTIGKAELVSDKAGKAAVWNDMYARFWPGGADDPDYAVIKVTPSQVEWFDTEKNMETEKIL
jgi:general stress protein 26